MEEASEEATEREKIVREEEKYRRKEEVNVHYNLLGLDSDVRNTRGPAGVDNETFGALGDDASTLGAGDSLDVGDEGAVLSGGLGSEGDQASSA